jgi:hypothetical protein
MSTRVERGQEADPGGILCKRLRRICDDSSASAQQYSSVNFDLAASKALNHIAPACRGIDGVEIPVAPYVTRMVGSLNMIPPRIEYVCAPIMQDNLHGDSPFECASQWRACFHLFDAARSADCIFDPSDLILESWDFLSEVGQKFRIICQATLVVGKRLFADF